MLRMFLKYNTDYCNNILVHKRQKEEGSDNSARCSLA